MKNKGRFDIEEGERVCFNYCYCTRTQRNVCCSIIWTPILVFLGLVIAIIVNTLIVEERFHLMELSPDPPHLLSPTPDEKLAWAGLLGGAIRIPTVSRDKGDLSLQELEDLHTYLRNTFPAVFTSDYVTVNTVNTHSLLLEITGSNDTGNPYLLCAHLDVVPSGDLDQWDHQPFLGEVIDQGGVQYVYGRGTVDDKHSVIGILQALQLILQDEGQPERSFYIGLGHDEEVGGEEGAAYIAAELQQRLHSRDEKLDFILDEGMFVNKGVIPGVEDPVIYIGVVEKGWTTLELSVSGAQGHSSAPPRQSTIGILSAAVVNLESNPHPAKFSEGPEYDSMSYLAPYATFVYKMALSNLWFFSNIISSILAGSKSTDAIQRTTTAVTIINGGFKENVLASSAKATVNHRIHPSSNLEEVLEHDRHVIGDDRVNIEVKGSFPPPAISSYSDNSIPFQIIANSAKQVFPEGRVIPGTLIGNTDTKHYLNLTDNIYRFTPAFLTANDTSRFHGFNERMSVSNFAQVVGFYYRLMQNADYFITAPSPPSSIEGSPRLFESITEESGSGGQEWLEVTEDYEVRDL